MKLINNTKYDSVQLLALIRAVYRKGCRKHGSLRKWNRTEITVVYARIPGDYRAYAEVPGIRIWLHLPRRRASTAMVTYIVDHELKHLYGWNHSDRTVFPWVWPTNFKPWRWLVSQLGQTLRKGS